MYQHVRLVDGAPLAVPGPLPDFLTGLDEAGIADLSWLGEPLRAAYAGTGFWPVIVTDPTFNPATEILTAAIVPGQPDGTHKTVPAVRGKRFLTDAEKAARAPRPRPLEKLAFVLLVQQVGGMTDAQLVAAQQAPSSAAFWIKFQMASQVERDHPVTAAALAMLAGGGWLPNGAAAVISAWPTDPAPA